MTHPRLSSFCADGKIRECAYTYFWLTREWNEGIFRHFVNVYRTVFYDLLCRNRYDNIVYAIIRESCQIFQML